MILHLQQGKRVVYLSDAGTPGVSDPGARLVALVRQAGFRTLPLPGASSITALLSVSGCMQDSGFVFVCFLPAKATERLSQLRQMAAEPRAQVFLEAPHRIESLAKDLAVWDNRLLTIGRELTKQFEEVASCRHRRFTLGYKPMRNAAKENSLWCCMPCQRKPIGWNKLNVCWICCCPNYR